MMELQIVQKILIIIWYYTEDEMFYDKILLDNGKKLLRLFNEETTTLGKVIFGVFCLIW